MAKRSQWQYHGSLGMHRFPFITHHYLFPVQHLLLTALKIPPKPLDFIICAYSVLIFLSASATSTVRRDDHPQHGYQDMGVVEYQPRGQ